MSRADGVLHVVLTGKWFDTIERGEKLEEYRGRHWYRRILSNSGIHFISYHGLLSQLSQARGDFHPYHTFVASRGYTSRTLTRKIKRIRWGQPRPEWSGDTVTGACFIIELEAAP